MSPSAQSRDGHRAVHLTQRVLLCVFGGHLVAAGLAGVADKGRAGSVLLPGEAVILMAMLAFVSHLTLFVRGFAERRHVRLWAVSGVGGGLGWALLALPGPAGSG